MNELPKEESGHDASHARFRIKTPAGEVEVVGSEGFVERRWADVSAALMKVGERADVSLLREPSEVERALPKESKKIIAKRRAGPSCASRIQVIQESGFFQQPRKSGDVVAKLVELATPYEPKHVAAALLDLTKSSKLRRLKGPDGDWSYVNP